MGACIVRDGLVRYANPALLGIIGGALPDPSAGFPLLAEFLHPDHCQRFMARYERFIASASEERVFRTEFLHREGHGVAVEVKACRTSAGEAGASILLYVQSMEKAKGLSPWGDERFRSLIENASDIIIVLDEKGIITYEAPSTRNIMGYPDGYFIGRNPFDLIHPEDRPAVEEAFRALLASNHFELQTPFRFQKADGTWTYLDAMGKNLRQTPGIRGYVVTCRDMSSRVQSEKRLEQNLAITRSLINAMDNAALLLDNRGVILAANHMIARYLGKPLEQLIGTDITESMPPDDLKKWQNRWRRFRPGGEPIRYSDRIGQKDFEISVHPLNDADGQLVQIAIFGYDVTQRRIDEEALKGSRREWMTIFQAVGHPIVILDADQRIIRANQAVCLVLGKKEPEIIGRRCYEVFHGPGRDRPPRRCPMQRLLRTEEIETGEMEMEALCGDYIVSCTPVLDAEGNLEKVIHVATDITERKQAERRLEGERAFLRQVIDAVPAFISVKDAEGRFELANKALARACGTTPDLLIGRTMADFNPNPEEVRKMHADNLDVIRNCREMFVPEEKTTYPDPSVQWLSIYKAPLIGRDNQCQRILTVSTDITHLKTAEEEKRLLQNQLLRVQKMEAIGTLAGGIAHDFNNILMGIQGYISLMLFDTKPGHPHREKLADIESYIERGAGLTKQLLGFARGGKYDVMPTDMNDLIGKNAELFGRTRKEISISSSFSPELWAVEVDQGQMDQVLLNLFINASQAMPGGGNLELRTDNVVVAESDEKRIDVRRGRYVRITVSDNGMGMDSNTLERAFDPFFTTKPKGVGSGLGLASVYGIIKNHGGSIQVFSEPGKGATFQIYLPASDNKPAVWQPRDEALLTGRETILVVDDERINVTAMVEMLEMLHYRVLPVGSGQEAVAVYMEKGKEIDLVILDLVMPGISGGRTFDILREVNPNVDVILASGYSAGSEVRQLLNRGCRGFIQKPFQLQTLSRKVREVLDKKAQRVA